MRKAKTTKKKSTARQPTVAAGGVIERDLVRRWARRGIGDPPDNEDGSFSDGYVEALEELLRWLKSQPARTKRQGGIGR